MAVRGGGNVLVVGRVGGGPAAHARRLRKRPMRGHPRDEVLVLRRDVLLPGERPVLVGPGGPWLRASPLRQRLARAPAGARVGGGLPLRPPRRASDRKAPAHLPPP